MNSEETKRTTEAVRKNIVDKALEIVMWGGKVNEHGSTAPDGNAYRRGAWFEGNGLQILYESKPTTSDRRVDGYHLVMIYLNGELVFKESEGVVKKYAPGGEWEQVLWQLHKEVLKLK